MPDLTCWFFPGPEYGTTEAAWKAVLVEADRRCELHLRVKDNLLNEVSERYIWIVNTTVWSGGEQYKELAEGQLPQADDAIEGEKGDGGAVQKSSKALGKAFREGGQVQGEIWIWLSTRPTPSLLQTNYHMACKNEKTAVNQERNATKDSSLSQDQVWLASVGPKVLNEIIAKLINWSAAEVHWQMEVSLMRFHLDRCF